VHTVRANRTPRIGKKFETAAALADVHEKQLLSQVQYINFSTSRTVYTMRGKKKSQIFNEAKQAHVLLVSVL